MNWKTIHEKALEIVSDLKSTESKLIEILQQVDRDKIWEHFGLSSLYAYCIHILRISDDRAMTYMKIARKSVEVPALKEAIENKSLSVSNAKKIAKYISPENQTSWLEKAKTLSSRELEKEIVKEYPKEKVKERIIPVAAELAELRCLLSSEGEKLLSRALDILSQKEKRAVKHGEAVEAVLKDFVERHDPVKKAERALARKPQAPVTRPVYRNGKRTAIPKASEHEVMRRTQGQCTHIDTQGNRCSNRRWTDRHHIRLVAQGGDHRPSNLTLLCEAHHRMEHRNQPRYGK